MINEKFSGYATKENPTLSVLEGSVQSDFAQASTQTNLATGDASSYVEISHTKSLDDFVVSLTKSKNYNYAKIFFKKTAHLNEHHELSDDPILALQGKYQRAKNSDNLAFLIYVPQGRLNDAIKEIKKEVIPRYEAVLQAGMVQAGSDLAVAYYKLSELYDKLADKADVSGKRQMKTAALKYKTKSLALWKIYDKNDPDQVKTVKKTPATTTTTANKMHKASFPKKA